MKKKSNKQDLPINRVIVNPEFCKNLSIRVEIELEAKDPIPHFFVYIKDANPKKNITHIMMPLPEYRRGYTSLKLQGKNKQDFIDLMNSSWKGQVIVSRIDSFKSKKATGYLGAIQLWLDAYKDEYPNIHKLFKYDKKGFPLVPDYAEKLGKKFQFLVPDEKRRRRRRNKDYDDEILNNEDIDIEVDEEYSD